MLEDSSYQRFAVLSVAETFKLLKSTKKGLSSVDAKRRLVESGLNELRSRRVSNAVIFFRQFKSSFIYLLLFASLISLILGELADALFILFFIFLNAGLGFFQERKSERALEYLNQFWEGMVDVIREGKEQSVRISELVPGDILLLKPGLAIPADARVLEAQELFVDESALTGESDEVEKISGALKLVPEGYFQARSVLFSGTNVRRGEGRAIVFGTGIHSAVGTIQSLSADTKRMSAFEKGIASLSAFVMRTVLLTLLVVFVLNLMTNGGLDRLNEILLFSIALAVSVIPEALPLVTTMSLSAGAMHLAKNKVVVKRLSAIEDLGSIEILCTDKTGTITQNVLSVKSVEGPHADRVAVCAIAVADLEGALDDKHPDTRTYREPFDRALWSYANATIRSQASNFRIVSEIPFDPARRMNSAFVERGQEHFIIARGAPESILSRCDMGTTERSHWLSYAQGLGAQGYRVLAIAEKPWRPGSKSKNYSQTDESSMTWLGFVTFADPLKPDARESIHRARQLGIQVKILTGDSAAVAGSVATHIGLIASHEQVITGEAFMSLDASRKEEVISTHHVFARLSPEQKHAIITLLKQKATVGFLGEGFNDAPALKAAHVSIVVSEATNISRESADIVLLNKGLTTIITGIEEGRKIFANTLKYIKNTLASNFGNFYAIAIVSLLIPFLPMLPIQILLVNLLSDFPMVTVATDTVGAEELKKPKRYDIKELALITTVIGLVSTAFDFMFFAIFKSMGPDVMRTMWFMESILTELALVYSFRTRLPFWKAPKPSAYLGYLSVFAALATVVIPFLTFGQSIFHFVTPRLNHVAFTLFFVGCYFASTEIVKLWYYRFVRRPTA